MSPSARSTAAARRAEQLRREKRRRLLTVGGVVTLVAVVVAVMVIIYVTKSAKKNSASRVPASPAVVKQLTTLPPSAFEKVGAGTTSGGPTKVSGSALTTDGKPTLFYYGAEYCPFCATERWPLVVALSRFGTWSGLKQTTSASQDNPASIPTFSFYGASFTSSYLAFEAVETYTNQRSGDFYAKLETPTAAQQALVERYDGSNGSIPFIDFDNKYVSSGATYDYRVLQGKSPDEIATAIADTQSDVSRGALGAANSITATVCQMTGGQPGSVCDTPTITKLRAGLATLKG